MTHPRDHSEFPRWGPRYCATEGVSGYFTPSDGHRYLDSLRGRSERMGTKAGLRDARYDLQRVWSRLPADGPLASRIALKLGDFDFRLGDPDNALAWRARCFQ